LGERGDGSCGINFKGWLIRLADLAAVVRPCSSRYPPGLPHEGIERALAPARAHRRSPCGIVERAGGVLPVDIADEIVERLGRLMRACAFETRGGSHAVLPMLLSGALCGCANAPVSSPQLDARTLCQQQARASASEAEAARF
jgi:hypothetical protein